MKETNSMEKSGQQNLKQNRTWFALKQGWRWRKALKRSLTAEHSVDSVCQITATMLRARHVRCLVLDFDGVMASHAETAVHADVATWLSDLAKEWPLTDVVVLSNKPFSERINALKASFPDIHFVQGVAPKPFPNGLLEIAKQRHLSTDELLLVDDRIGTGMLAIVLAGAQGLLVLQPYQNYCKRPFKELFFSLLRKMERTLLRLFG